MLSLVDFQFVCLFVCLLFFHRDFQLDNLITFVFDGNFIGSLNIFSWDFPSLWLALNPPVHVSQPVPLFQLGQLAQPVQSAQVAKRLSSYQVAIDFIRYKLKLAKAFFAYFRNK